MGKTAAGVKSLSFLTSESHKLHHNSKNPHNSTTHQQLYQSYFGIYGYIKANNECRTYYCSQQNSCCI